MIRIVVTTHGGRHIFYDAADVDAAIVLLCSISGAYPEYTFDVTDAGSAALATLVADLNWLAEDRRSNCVAWWTAAWN